MGLCDLSGGCLLRRRSNQRACPLISRLDFWLHRGAKLPFRLLSKGKATVAKKYQVLGAGLIGVAAGLTGMVASAQTSSAIEEIVVTAQKREQNLQEVGIAVTAFTGEQMRELGLSSSTDIVSMTPGLNYTTPNADSSVINFVLRGVGLNDFADASENPVAVYVDDVYRPASGGLSFEMFDLDRV